MVQILHKRKAADPTAGYIEVGELAINTSDGGLFTKTSGGSVVEIGSAATGGATGAGGDAVFWENGQTVTTDYTITNNSNAGSFGPITINNNITVTIGSGETWTVV